MPAFFLAWAQDALDAVFQGWWQVLEKGQKLDQKTATYANQALGWLKEGLAPACIPLLLNRA